jgi:hypothetical protein
MRFALASCLLIAACNPYDPDLGNNPFRCGTDEPSCPGGYVCNEDNVCVKGSGGAPDAGSDGSSLTCNDDSDIEPNDMVSNAFVTPIPDFDTCVALRQLAICPDTDKDLFRFRVDDTGKNMRTTVTTDVSAGQLTLRVLNGSGNAIGSGLPINSTEIEIVINNLSTGNYYVEVGAPAGVQNNYLLDIVTCDQSGCPGITCD